VQSVRPPDVRGWVCCIALGSLRMPTIERRVSPDDIVSYRVRVRLRGARVVSATFARLTDAKRWAQSTESAIREGRYFKTAEGARHTVSDALDRYAREVLPHKPRTAPFQRRQLEWWRKQIGHLLLVDLTAPRIVECRARLLSELGSRSQRRGPSTANRYVAALSHVLSVAVREWEWVDDNPARRVTKLREPRGRARFLSEDERTRLLAACRGSAVAGLYAVVVLAIATGMRRNEIMSLSRSQIDLDRGLITLDVTKNGERRCVALAAYPRSALEEHLRCCSMDTGLLFPGTKPNRPFDLRKPWAVAIKEAGLADFRFHDLRHTTASYLAMTGAQATDIAAVLGHKTLAMVKRYTHLADSHVHKVVAVMNEKIFGHDQP
jgi:integrase